MSNSGLIIDGSNLGTRINRTEMFMLREHADREQIEHAERLLRDDHGGELPDWYERPDRFQSAGASVGFEGVLDTISAFNRGSTSVGYEDVLNKIEQFNSTSDQSIDPSVVDAPDSTTEPSTEPTSGGTSSPSDSDQSTSQPSGREPAPPMQSTDDPTVSDSSGGLSLPNVGLGVGVAIAVGLAALFGGGS